MLHLCFSIIIQKNVVCNALKRYRTGTVNIICIPHIYSAYHIYGKHYSRIL
jgi:hypothetical protein